MMRRRQCDARPNGVVRCRRWAQYAFKMDDGQVWHHCWQHECVACGGGLPESERHRCHDRACNCAQCIPEPTPPGYGA